MHRFPWKAGKRNKSYISKAGAAWVAHQLDNHVLEPEATSELSSQLLSVELAKEVAAEVLSTWASGSCRNLMQPVRAAHPLPGERRSGGVTCFLGY